MRQDAPPGRQRFAWQGLALIGELAHLLRQAEGPDQALRSALELLCAYMGASAGLVWRVDPSGRWRVLVSQGSRSSLMSLRALDPEPADELDATLDEHAQGGDAVVRVRTPEGEPAAVLRLAGISEMWTQHELAGTLPTVSDLLETAWASLDRQLRSDQAQQTASIGNWLWRSDLDAVWLSEQMYRTLGVDPDSFDHSLQGYLDRVHPHDREPLAQQLDAAGDQGGSWHSVHRVVTDPGEIRWIESSGQITRDDDGVVVRLSGVGQDITRRRGLEQALSERDERDALTGLASRNIFWERLSQMLDRQGEQDGCGTVVAVLVDIVGFRGINDLYGWEGGDRVLQEVAKRLRAVDRNVLVARLSADEFGLMFTDPRSSLERLGEAITSRSHDQVELAVGIASNLDAGDSADKLLRAAGAALDVAKSRTDARWQVFDPAKHQQAIHRLAIEADLRRAVGQGEIGLAFQPIVDLASGEITGVEALARWHSPGYGPVSPSIFIPLAERAGLIGRLSTDLLERACGQLRAWEQAHPRVSELRMSFNLSAVQLDDPHLVETVADILARHELAYHRLVLEVTETALNHDRPGALARLFELRCRGVLIAIDDFGTGYSSLARLRELPFDILKIDRSFVQGIANSREPTPILEALFSMSRSLGLEVVAEGVETPVQLAVMLRHGCGSLQGFLLSRPLDAAGLDRLLADETSWDPAAIASQVPDPANSPRLQQLLDQVAESIGEVSPTVIADILDVLAEITELDSVYVTGIDFREQLQEVLAARNSGPIQIDEGMQVRWEDTLCRRALAADTPVIHDVQHAYPELEAARELGIGTYVGIELHGPKGELSGTLCGVNATATDISQQTVETLRWVARLLASPRQPTGGRLDAIPHPVSDRNRS